MTSLNFDILRERCPDCDSDILCHNKIMLCQGCNVLFHASCSEKSFKFDNVKLAWVCSNCMTARSERYNPFCCSADDKYDQTPAEGKDDLEAMSNILKNCSIYMTKRSLTHYLAISSTKNRHIYQYFLIILMAMLQILMPLLLISASMKIILKL